MKYIMLLSTIFIMLTDINGNGVRINLDAISYYKKCYCTNTDWLNTTVYMAGGSIDVLETMDDIDTIIQDPVSLRKISERPKTKN